MSGTFVPPVAQVKNVARKKPTKNKTLNKKQAKKKEKQTNKKTKEKKNAAPSHPRLLLTCYFQDLQDLTPANIFTLISQLLL